MNKFVSVTVIAAMVLVALAAFALPASAQVICPGPGHPGAGCAAVTKYYNGTMNGSIYFEQQGYSVRPLMTRTFTNVPDGIKIAKVYTGVWGGSPCKGGDFNITIVNNTGIPYTTPDNISGAMYRSCDPCPNKTNCLEDGWQCPGRCDALRNDTVGNLGSNSGFADLPDIHDYIVGCGVHFISYNATPYIAPGTNTITVQTRKNYTCNCPTPLDCGDGWDGRIYVIALMVIYENTDMPEITYWVNEGGPYLEKDSECDGPFHHIYASKYFNGTIVSDPTRVSLWSLGFPHVINTYDPSGTPGAYTELNDINIGPPGVVEAHSGDEVLLRWNLPPTYVNGVSNFLEYNDPMAYYERAFAEVLIVHGHSNKPDLIVPDIQFPPVMRPSTPHTITATVENQGGVGAGASTACLYVDDVLNDTFAVPALAAGANTTASFDVTPLAEGCYEFRVVADCTGGIDEDNEFNNATTEKYQVGNVIVVNGNGGFATTGLPSGNVFYGTDGVWYIQDLDITNCACSGVNITDTNVPFVIRNCTIHDCNCNGVYFNNATNGKVNESEIRDNGLKGIRMENCSYVTIETNSMHDNAMYGVDVYMDTMPRVDSHHITISNNTITGGICGIELLGNDCTVRCNTIEDTTGSYAVYVSGNYSVIHNNTIRNNPSYGIQVDSTWIQTIGNWIYGNDFINNGGGVQAFDNGTNTRWNTSTEVNYYYNNSDPLYFNYTGNYWSDYSGNYHNNNNDDPDGDGIGNTPYAIDGVAGAADSYPRIVTLWVCGDVDGDERVIPSRDRKKISIGDIRTSEWAADVDCDCRIIPSRDGKRIANGILECCSNCTSCV